MNRATRKVGAIEQMPDRTNGVDKVEETNYMTPRTAESKTSRENKGRKQAKMQQTITPL